MSSPSSLPLPLLSRPLDELDASEIAALAADFERAYERVRGRNLQLDLTRGKPSAEQLDLSDDLDGILEGEFHAEDGTDSRNYGGLDGLPEAKRLGAMMLDMPAESVMVGGNSSLTLMYLYVMHAFHFGVGGGAAPWRDTEHGACFLCPSPGYDRHFTICEEFGIEMIPVPLTGQGPDMDRVEALMADDPRIRGIWCVPKYSNPTGETYSTETVERIAALPRIADPAFRVLWDNAYANHHLGETAQALANIWEVAGKLGTRDGIVTFGSTSKVTLGGAGLSFLAASELNRKSFEQRLSSMTIGPDKVNQLRHVRKLGTPEKLREQMRGHAAIIAPKFARVQDKLTATLAGTGLARWTKPAGGYFVSVDTVPGIAKAVVALAAAAGVKLTPAGAAFPGGKDPEDRNIRLAPTFPPLQDVEQAMDVFVLCVALAALRARAREHSDGAR